MLLMEQRAGEPDRLARDLLREQALLIERHQRISALQTRIAEYERRFGIASSHVHDAIDEGTLAESADVCDWLMDYEMLQRVMSVAAR